VDLTTGDLIMFILIVRLVLIVGGAILCSSAFWGALVVVFAQRALHVRNESILLSLFILTSLICLALCIFVLPKHLKKAEII
jgi:ABC-type enterochelin transport system permease subunit